MQFADKFKVFRFMPIDAYQIYLIHFELILNP